MTKSEAIKMLISGERITHDKIMSGCFVVLGLNSIEQFEEFFTEEDGYYIYRREIGYGDFDYCTGMPL